MALKVHPEVLGKDIEFKQSSEDADYEFNKITPTELSKIHESYIKSMAPTGNEPRERSSYFAYKKKAGFAAKKTTKKKTKNYDVDSDIDYGFEEVIY
jgi:hypothetical protein